MKRLATAVATAVSIMVQPGSAMYGVVNVACDCLKPHRVPYSTERPSGSVTTEHCPFFDGGMAASCCIHTWISCGNRSGGGICGRNPLIVNTWPRHVATPETIELPTLEIYFCISGHTAMIPVGTRS